MLSLSEENKENYYKLFLIKETLLANQTADSMSLHAHSATSLVVRSCFKLKPGSVMAAHIQQQSQLTFKAMESS